MPSKRTIANKLIASVEQIESRIFLIRGQKVMLDADLAELYEVETKASNRAVKRNPDRFPEDFMFQLSADEFENLRFQSGTSSLKSQIDTSRWGGRRYPQLGRLDTAWGGLGTALCHLRLYGCPEVYN